MPTPKQQEYANKKTQQTKRLIEGGLTVIYTSILILSKIHPGTGVSNPKDSYELGKTLAKQTVYDFGDALEDK